ncbi:hypothetical protein N6H14_27675 [Paenibacillus sp. CC-CFT747]|nr:hypothetical protein N6H14_27675 [Paenibacillus sp. CC-CFT747]
MADDESSAFKYDGTDTSEVLPEAQRELLDWSAFYGLALPLVKKGIPLRPVQLDNLLAFPGYLDGYRVLLLSYEFMKPEHPGLHQVLAQWVREGGILLYYGDGTDPFHEVSEWWNRSSGSRTYERPEHHLFEALGLGREPAEGDHPAGAGALRCRRIPPASLSRTKEGARLVTEDVRWALERRGKKRSTGKAGFCVFSAGRTSSPTHSTKRRRGSRLFCRARSWTCSKPTCRSWSPSSSSQERTLCCMISPMSVKNRSERPTPASSMGQAWTKPG